LFLDIKFFSNNEKLVDKLTNKIIEGIKEFDVFVLLEDKKGTEMY